MIEDMTDAIEAMSSGTYVVTRRPATVFVTGKKVEPILAAAWEPETAYALNARAGNGGAVYEATVGGTSAPAPATGPSGGPGTTGIADGSVTWRWLAPRVSTFAASASVQPLNGRELDRLPEAMRARELIALFTGTELRTAIAGAGEPDSVSIDGESYEVQSVERWDKLGNYYRAIVAKIGR